MNESTHLIIHHEKDKSRNHPTIQYRRYKANLMNLAKSIEACAAHGAQPIVLQELHIHFISARQKTLTCLILPNQFPGLPQAFIPSWQQLIK